MFKLIYQVEFGLSITELWDACCLYFSYAQKPAFGKKFALFEIVLIGLCWFD